MMMMINTGGPFSLSTAVDMNTGNNLMTVIS